MVISHLPTHIFLIEQLWRGISINCLRSRPPSSIVCRLLSAVHLSLSNAVSLPPFKPSSGIPCVLSDCLPLLSALWKCYQLCFLRFGLLPVLLPHHLNVINCVTISFHPDGSHFWGALSHFNSFLMFEVFF